MRDTLQRWSSLLLVAVMLLQSGCSFFSSNAEQDTDIEAPELVEGSLTEEEVLALLGGSAYIPLDMEGEQAYRVVEDFLYLQYFTPSPFYTSQSPNSFNTLLDQRAAEASAMGASLGNDVEELLDAYISLGEAAAAVLDELTVGYNAQEEYSWEQDLYVSLQQNMAREMNLYLYNTRAYLTTAEEWGEAANDAAPPFRTAQAEYFHMLHNMRAALELLEGFERVAIQARGLVAVCPGTSGEAELLRTLEALAADERIPALAAKTTTLLQGISDACEGNQQQALAILGERMHTARDPGDEVWADMDALSYKLLNNVRQEDGVNAAVPENLRPVSMSVSGDERTPNAATRLIATPLEEIMAEHLLDLQGSFDSFWSEQVEGIAEQLAANSKEDGLLLLWQTFARDISEEDLLVEVLERPRPMDTVIPTVAATEFYQETWDGYLRERSIAPELAREYAGLEGIVSQSGQILSALSESAQDITPVSTLETPMAVLLAYTPQQNMQPRIEEMAAVRFYVDGVAFTDMSLVQMVNLVTGCLPISGGAAGIDFAAHSYLYQSMRKVNDPNDLQELARVAAIEMDAMLDSLVDWVEDMLSRNGYTLGAFDIEMVLDLSDPIDPDPPKTAGIDREAFNDFLSSSYGLLSWELMRNINWEGTMTLRRVEANDYNLLYDYYMYEREMDESFRNAGITQPTYEMAHAYYEAMRDAAAAGFTFPAQLKVITLREALGEYGTDERLSGLGFEGDETAWRLTSPEAQMTEAGVKNVFVDEIRSTVQIYYKQFKTSREDLAPKRSDTHYSFFRDELIVTPYYNETDGIYRLTGYREDTATYENGGELTGYWEVNMTGIYTEPKDDGIRGTTNKQETSIDIIVCGPIGPQGEPKEPPPPPPPPPPPIEPPPIENEPEDPPPPPPPPVLVVDVQGHWEGSVVITNSYGSMELHEEKLEQAQETERFTEVDHTNLEQLLGWQESDRGIGVRRFITLDILPNKEGHISLSEAPAARKGAPDTEFLLWKYTGSTDTRTVNSRKNNMTIGFSEGESSIYWERYSLDLDTHYGNGTPFMTGTMTWRSDLTGRTIVYDVYLVKTGAAQFILPEDGDSGESNESTDEPDDSNNEQNNYFYGGNASGGSAVPDSNGEDAEDAEGYASEDIPDDGQEEG